MTLEDLETLFWGGEREQPVRVRLARVVKALRDEMHAHPGECWACEDNCNKFDQILGDAGSEKVAGGPTREDGRSVEQLVATASHAVTAPAAPAPVCVWTPLGDRHGVFMRQCSKYPAQPAAGPYCSNCGKPITEAQR